MGIETLLLIAIVAALGFALLAFSKSQQSNKYLDAVRDLERQRDRLKSENADLRTKKGGKPEAAPAKKDDGGKKKKKKKADSPVDTDGAKLKEENYHLKQELKDLRKAVRGEDGAASKTQKALADAREEAERLRKERDDAQHRFEAAVADRAARDAEEGVVKAKGEEGEDEAASAAASEVDRLKKALADQRENQSNVEKGLRNQIDNAKKDAAAARSEARKETRNAKRQASRSTKRAENNHKVYLITRNRLLAAEERLAQLDASYTRSNPLPTSNQGIEEAIKMHDTRDARSAKLHEDVERAQARIAELEAQLAGTATPEAKPAKAEQSAPADADEAAPAESKDSEATPKAKPEGARVRRKSDATDDGETSKASKASKAKKTSKASKASDEKPAKKEKPAKAKKEKPAKEDAPVDEKQPAKASKATDAKADKDEAPAEPAPAGEDVDAGWDAE